MPDYTISYRIHTRARDSGTSYTREVSTTLTPDDDPLEATDKITDLIDELFDATENRKRRRRRP